METPFKVPLWLLESALTNEKEQARLAMLEVIKSSDKITKRLEKYPLPNKTTQVRYDAHMKLEAKLQLAQTRVKFLKDTINRG